MIQKTVLNNGLRIITDSMEHVKSVSIGIFVGVGSRDEDDTNRGISHAIEHMLFKGTTNRTSEQITDEISSLGGRQNAWTDKESTCYYVKMLQEHTGVGVDILSDMFLNSLFLPEELEKERKVILEEIKQYQDDPVSVCTEALYENLYPTHNLGREIIGYADTVSRFTSQQLIDYRNQKYTPDNIVISVSGKVEHNFIVDMIAERFSDVSGKESSWRSPYIHPVPNTGVYKINKEIEQAHVAIGIPGLSCFSRDRYKADLLGTILGGGMSSRLFKEVREKRGLAYSVSTNSYEYKEAGVFFAYAATNRESVDDVIDIFRNEFDKISEESFSDCESELNLAKNLSKSRLIFGEEATNARMQSRGITELILNEEYSIEEEIRSVDSVTCEDVQSIAKELLAPEKQIIIQISNTES